jgi:hypothetical protein
LTTQDQTTIERTKPPKGAGFKKEIANNTNKQKTLPACVRCSRPLCSSQTTTPYHTPPHQPPPAHQRTKEQPNTHRKPCSQETRNTKPGTGTQPVQATHHPGPVASGPNSVPNTKTSHARTATLSTTPPTKRGGRPYSGHNTNQPAAIC